LACRKHLRRLRSDTIGRTNTLISPTGSKAVLTVHAVSSNKAPIDPIPAKSEVTCDVVGPFPTTTAENKYIVVFVDRFTGWTEAFSTATTDAPIIADLLLNHIVLRYGAPQTFLTDRGTNFFVKTRPRIMQTY